jgi:hypothetical protein
MPDSSHPLPALGTETMVGQASGLDLLVRVQGPADQATPLQVICLFENTNPQDIYQSPPALPAALNGLVHVDQALHGLLTELRQSGRFRGFALETLLLLPPAGTLKAPQLLLIGLGSRAAAQQNMAALMHQVGLTGMREALRLAVPSYSHAANLQDGGLGVVPADITQAVLAGTLEAYRTQHYLAARQAAPEPLVRQFTMLTGPATFALAGEGVTAFLQNYSTEESAF